MLDAKLQQQLQTYLQNLKTPVELLVSGDDSAKAGELSQLANQLADMHELISVTADNNLPRTPSMVVRSAAKDTEITFAGVPMGHEFTSLVLALLHSGGHPIKADADVLQQIEQLEGEFQFEAYVSLSCQVCPEVIQALNLMAAVNPNIRCTMVDGSMFPQEVSERNIMAVPTVYLNGKQFSQGRVTVKEILNKLDKNSATKAAEVIKEKAPFDVLVVGGGPAGAAAAIYAARKGIRTGVVSERFGGQVLDTMAIENFISVKATDGPKLAAGLEEHVREYDVDIIDTQRAVKLKPASQQAESNLIEIELASGATLQSRSVLLATGARWREMGVPGEQEYRGRGVAYCPHCDGPLFKGKSVAVIGGGNSGIEAAIDLAGIVNDVVVLEFDSKLRADEVLQRKARSMGNIRMITNAQTTEVLGDDQRVTGLTYTDRNSGEQQQINLAGVFVQIGLVPNTEWLKCSIDLTERGEIIVGARGETSEPGVFAAGDATNLPYKQIIIAMGSGANASLGAFDYLIRLPVAESVIEQEQAA